MHGGVNPEVCDFPGCNYASKNQIILIAHKKKHDWISIVNGRRQAEEAAAAKESNGSGGGGSKSSTNVYAPSIYPADNLALKCIHCFFTTKDKEDFDRHLQTAHNLHCLRCRCGFSTPMTAKTAFDNHVGKCGVTR